MTFVLRRTVFHDGERRLDDYEVCYKPAAKRLGGPRRDSKGIHLEREPKRALGIGGALSGISLPRGRDKVVLWNSVPPYRSSGEAGTTKNQRSPERTLPSTTDRYWD